MDRREALKKLALGGVTIVGGTGLIAGAAVAAPRKGGGKPDPGTEEPPPDSSLPIGEQLPLNSPAWIELLFFGGGRAKARFRLYGTEAVPQPLWHGWDLVDDALNSNMDYEQLSLETRSIAGTEQLDVKGKLDSGQKSGHYTFDYWHGPNPDGSNRHTTYRIRVNVLNRGDTVTWEVG